MPHRSIVFVFTLLVVVPAHAAVGVSAASAHDIVAGPPDVTIMVGSGLSDREVHVRPGDIVRFQNADDRRHRFRSRSGGGFDTGNIETGEFAQVRLAAAGIHAYIDERDDHDARYYGRIVVGTAGTGSGSATIEGKGAPTAHATVTIGDRIYLPATTRIQVGGSVTFRNEDSDQHTATGGIIASGTLSPGASYTQTFSMPGTYDFLCNFHPEMRGTIEVEGGTPTPSPTPTPAPTSSAIPTPDDRASAVEILDFAFDRSTLEVPTGTTVRWTNAGVAPHTVTAGDGSFDSGTLQSGGTFERTFATPGTFTYACQIHPDMTGTIEVRVVAAVDPPAATKAPASPVEAGDTAAPTTTVDARPASADLGSLGGIALAVTLISVASALFARLLRGSVRT